MEETAKQTLNLIGGNKTIMQEYKNRIRAELPNLNSEGLLDNLFKHPYTKIKFLESDPEINRKTAAKYLNHLTERELLEKVKIWKTNFYVNQPLYNLFKEGLSNTQPTEPIKTITDSKE